MPHKIRPMSKKKPKVPSSTIALNKKAKHEYFIEDRFEAGLCLEGWEVKSIRDNRLSFQEAFVQIHQGEAFLHGVHITPLASASTHVDPHPTRPRKLLLHKKEIARLIGGIDRQGYTIVPTALYWSKGRVKVEIGLAKGKKEYDKRASKKEADWNRQKQRIMKHSV